MLAADQNIRNHFHIAVKENRVISFEGESMLVKARKEESWLYAARAVGR